MDRFGDKIDLSIIEPSDWEVLNEEWQGLAQTIDAERKMGVRNRGLCLLLAYTFQCLEYRRRAAER